jgi:hypothetical protein
MTEVGAIAATRVGRPPFLPGACCYAMTASTTVTTTTTSNSYNNNTAAPGVKRKRNEVAMDMGMSARGRMVVK